ncbi:MAG: hypothetical protein P9L90_05875 [Candidatus Aadella gelida]|nr:hypothetical protein [Candidatus Aadella gelida]
MIKLKKDIAYQELLDKLAGLNSLKKKENEATTRLRAIDTLLFDILKWDKSEIEAEKYCRQEGYADYVFHINNNLTLVLEAKKAGTSFILPDKAFTERPYVFGLFSKECPEAYKALQQVIGYAASLGARYVAISNGHQWIFTIPYVPNQPLEKRLVYIFESFEALLERFSLFCDCFSREGLHLNLGKKYLLDTLQQPAPAKLSSKVSGYPVASVRNVYQNEITYILLDDSLHEIYSGRNDINSRLDRTEKFISYLDTCSKHIQNPELESCWSEIRNKANGNITKIREALSR